MPDNLCRISSVSRTNVLRASAAKKIKGVKRVRYILMVDIKMLDVNF
jgi:hypothetical protein